MSSEVSQIPDRLECWLKLGRTDPTLESSGNPILTFLAPWVASMTKQKGSYGCPEWEMTKKEYLITKHRALSRPPAYHPCLLSLFPW